MAFARKVTIGNDERYFHPTLSRNAFKTEIMRDLIEDLVDLQADPADITGTGNKLGKPLTFPPGISGAGNKFDRSPSILLDLMEELILQDLDPSYVDDPLNLISGTGNQFSGPVPSSGSIHGTGNHFGDNVYIVSEAKP